MSGRWVWPIPGSACCLTMPQTGRALTWAAHACRPAGITLVCLHCLVEDHPELACGLEIAANMAWRISTTTASGSLATSAGSIGMTTGGA